MDSCERKSEFHRELQNAGGFYESSSDDVVTIPLSSASAQQLRRSLTGKPLTLNPEDAKTLSEFADSKNKIHSSHVFPSRLAHKVVIDASHVNMNDYNTLTARMRKGNFFFPVSDSAFIVPLTEVEWIMGSIKLNVSPALSSEINLAKDIPEIDPFGEVVSKQEPVAEIEEIKEIALPDLPPFSGYDGTLASLKWVPLEAYEHIRKDSEKTSNANRKIAEHNKRAKTAKQKKKLKRSLAQKLSSFGISNAFDILHHFPSRHIDRSTPKLIRQLKEGDEATVLGFVQRVTTNGEKRFVTMAIKDMMGDSFSVTFFQQLYLGRMYFTNDEVLVTGKYSPFRNVPSFASPRIDKVGSDRASMPMIPIYPQSEKQELTTWDLLELVKETLGRLGSIPLSEPLTKDIMDSYAIPSRTDAYKDIHLPRSPKHFEDANRRLVYEELLRLQLMIQRQKRDITQARGLAQNSTEKTTVDSWRESLPYALTGAQERAIKEISANMESPNPMHRLIQGDVGSGKSSLASFTVFKAVDNGHQAALMAPTEILAEQLHNGIINDAQNFISPRTGGLMNIQFLGGKTTAANARKIRASLADGSVDIVVGTHALLTETTVFKDLGVVVIDEQHRFGVDQRTILRSARKDGLTPDMLLMTATPIPRSSAMVLYGDLDITILDELPPGRKPIETIWTRIEAQKAVHQWNLTPWEDIRNEVRNGHQAYIVASLVEDNEKIAAQSVEEAFALLSANVFPEFKLGMVHGKQKRPEREEIMKAFAKGEINILIATTVIEVGVNVPNSTVMVVLDPGRFGIAQLHQIRGRVGRSSLPSRCYLLGDTKTSEGEFRLNALVESTDGFYLSEKDLELRGEGTLFSTKQSGQSDMFLAKISEHMHVLEIAKKDAEVFLNADPLLNSHAGRIFSSEMEDIFQDKEIKS